MPVTRVTVEYDDAEDAARALRARVMAGAIHEVLEDMDRADTGTAPVPDTPEAECCFVTIDGVARQAITCRAVASLLRGYLEAYGEEPW